MLKAPEITVRTSSTGCLCAGTLQPFGNLSRSTNKPSLLGSPNRTAASAPGGSMAGAGAHLMSCGETLVCPSIVSAGVVKATPATATTTISVGSAIVMVNLLSRQDFKPETGWK